MSSPYSSPGIRTLLSAIVGVPVEGNTPRWMDRRYGYHPKRMKGRNAPAKPKKK